jgi:hypothetical protein
LIYILFFPMGFCFYEVATQHGILSCVWMEVSHVGLRGVFEYAAQIYDEHSSNQQVM